MTFPPRNPRGILFSQAMVRALDDDRKTQTRRLAASPLRKVKPLDSLWVRETHAYVGSMDPGWIIYRAAGYEAECRRHGFDQPYPPVSEVQWTPSLLMKRRASRLTLIVDAVRFERLHDISREDAIAEGIEVCPDVGIERGWWRDYSRPDIRSWFNDPVKSYESLWRSLHPETIPVRDPITKKITGHIPNPARWDANPELVVIGFEVARRNIDKAPAP